MRKQLFALGVLLLLPACGGGKSSGPTAVVPTTTTTTTTIPRPLFTSAGSGDNVFDMPTTVARVKITGDYPGRSTNFIVKIGGRLVVNELLGTAWPDGPHFEGTYLTSGGVVEITNSSGVAWTFTEIRS
jgi:hypothetical protein